MLEMTDNMESEGRLCPGKFTDFGADIFTPRRPFSPFPGCTTLQRGDDVARILTSE